MPKLQLTKTLRHKSLLNVFHCFFNIDTREPKFMSEKQNFLLIHENRT